MSTSTREQLLLAAMEQFARRGFYGASIASIAAELDLTKQALLHHFASKERLYGEILGLISSHAMASIDRARREHRDPAAQLEHTILGRFHEEMKRPDEARLLMRELLDNEQRAEKAGNWYLRPYLDALIDMLQAAHPERAYTRAQALAIVYQLLGAAHYFVISQPTLRHMYGRKFFKQTTEAYEGALRELVQRILTDPSKRN